MVYFGCRGCCAKSNWACFVITLVGAAVLLGVGLYRCIPCTTTLVRCVGTQTVGQNVQSSTCWSEYWKCNQSGLFFILSAAGVAALLMALFSCCCFLCRRNPDAPPKAKKGKKHEEQFMTGSGPMDAPAHHGAGDQATYNDQYAAYNPNAPVGTKPGSHYV